MPLIFTTSQGHLITPLVIYLGCRQENLKTRQHLLKIQLYNFNQEEAIIHPNPADKVIDYYPLSILFSSESVEIR